ncbi:Endoglucanase-4 [Arthrobotrys entomopaga]|nr:Endoglucanase-4 [Arthrobotrys entomopaga]
MRSIGFVAFLSAASGVIGHGYVYEYLINNQKYPGFDVYLPQKYSGSIGWSWAVTPDTKKTWDRDSPAMINQGGDALVCQKGAKPAPKSAPVTAGSVISFRWNKWPEDHRGPIITWLAECGNSGCSNVNPAKLKWFKIEEAGLVPGSNTKWAPDILIQQGDTWKVKIPKNIKNGNYILRHEIIAFHDLNGAQFYPICSNLKVTGGTGRTNPQGELIQQVYTMNEPSLKVSTKPGTGGVPPAINSYKIPGRPVDPSFGFTSSFALNTGAMEDGAHHEFPYKELDPYATGKRYRSSTSQSSNSRLKGMPLVGGSASNGPSSNDASNQMGGNTGIWNQSPQGNPNRQNSVNRPNNQNLRGNQAPQGQYNGRYNRNYKR